MFFSQGRDMKHAMLVLSTVSLIAPAGGRPVPTNQAYSVIQVRVGLAAHPQRWIGRTILVRGVALRAPNVGLMLRAPNVELMLVDTRLVVSLPQRDLTPDEATVMVERAVIESRRSSPVPILFLRSQYVSQYGHDVGYPRLKAVGFALALSPV
jgi:hypothetical protein